MNISALTITALLASTLHTGAQTSAKESLKPDTVKKAKTPSTQITEKHNQNQIQENTKKPTTTEHKRRYCPTCGRG